jgi:hypothetical protein
MSIAQGDNFTPPNPPPPPPPPPGAPAAAAKPAGGRQTFAITLPMPTGSAIYRCPFLRVGAGQQVSIAGGPANNVAGIRLWTQQSPPVNATDGNFQLISPGSAAALSVQVETTDVLWLSPGGAGDLAIITVRDSG